jgi:hypothetical protein
VYQLRPSDCLIASIQISVVISRLESFERLLAPNWLVRTSEENHDRITALAHLIVICRGGWISMNGPEEDLGSPYWVSEPWWGKGSSEAAAVAAEHAFQVTGIERLQGRCFLGNERSRRVLIGLGFRPTHIGQTYSKARGCYVVTQHFELTMGECRFRRHIKP